MTEHLLALSDGDLRSLANGLRSGRVGTAYGTMSLRRLGLDAGVERLVEELRAFAEAGFSPTQIAVLVDTVLADRRRPRDDGGAIDLVTTGPDTSSTRDTAVVVRELFAQAEQSVLVVGYAVHQGRRVFRTLAERMDEFPTLHARFCLDVRRNPGDTSAAAQIVQRFAADFRARQWPGSRLPEVYHDPRALSESPAERAALHAKCVVVDASLAFVSSANFTEAAQTRNVEVGILLRSPVVARRISNHFERLIETEALARLPT